MLMVMPMVEAYRMSGSRSLLTALATGIALTVAGPAAAENVLRWASAGGATTFDPHSFDETRTYAQLAQVYEGLSGLDSSLEFVPRLAVGWAAGRSNHVGVRTPQGCSLPRRHAVYRPRCRL
jgi:hypothetical protein